MKRKILSVLLLLLMMVMLIGSTIAVAQTGEGGSGDPMTVGSETQEPDLEPLFGPHPDPPPPIPPGDDD